MTDVRIITEPLGGSALSRLLQSGAAPSGWRADAPQGAPGWRERARRRRASADWASVVHALGPAFAATGRAAERLEQVISGGGVVVTTGQQPGLFGGPVYTWSKAVGALALAAALERATGIPTVAVYWAATDDADFAEASSTVVARPGGAVRLCATDAPPAGTPMSLAPLGDLALPLQLLREASGSAAGSGALRAALDAYGDPGRSAGDAFVALLRAMLAPLGMPVLDASHPAVHEASRATLERARGEAARVATAVTARSAEIAAAGHAPQVEDVPGASLVFVREGTTKRRLSVAEASGGPTTGILTPNVLLRPVVEHEILPTVAYLAGPGELAYFAQVGAVAAALGVEPPVALPRWSCTLVEPAVARLLDRYEATLDDLVAPDALETRLARRAMSAASSRAMETVRAAVRALPQTLGDDAAALGLEGAVQGAMQGLQHRIDRLERRLVAGIKRRDAERMREVGTVRGALRPFGTRQERALNLVPLLARHGSVLLEEMRDASARHAAALVEPTDHPAPGSTRA
jgi:uncharacterized protein YllA (UPF0747 family)